VRATRLTRDPGPAIYVPLRQYIVGKVAFIVRTNADLAVLAPSLRAALGAIDATVSVSSIDRMPTLVSRSYAEERYRTLIVGAFAALAAILASVGLYGVTLRAVTRRAREVGIRVALGATPACATRLLMSDTLQGVLFGLCWGIPLALLAGQRLAPYLFRVVPSDPLALGVVLGLLAVVALIASALPARRAGRCNPAVVLSYD
jgi:ABC-type antimicrobial peptide transport system permease subunit